mgnify:CR=1
MIEIVLGLLLIPQAMLGGIVLLMIYKPKDGWTNRISHLRLIWLALAYPSEFTQFFSWLEKDVHENIHKEQ